MDARRRSGTVLGPDLSPTAQACGRLARQSAGAGSLLAYFRLSSPEAFNRYWLGTAAAFRASPAFTASPTAVAAWLRWGEIEAEKIEVGAFEPTNFEEVLHEARTLCRVPFARALSRLQELLRSAGVVVVLVPELTGTHLNGASWWRGSSAVIQLSLRHKKDDQLWFTLFHEAGHLASGHRGSFVDGEGTVENAEEQAADAFARDALVPPEAWTVFISGAVFDEAVVRAFAQEQSIAPGIIVGRLQRERHLPRTHLNDLKRCSAGSPSSGY